MALRKEAGIKEWGASAQAGASRLKGSAKAGMSRLKGSAQAGASRLKGSAKAGMSRLKGSAQAGASNLKGPATAVMTEIIKATKATASGAGKVMTEMKTRANSPEGKAIRKAVGSSATAIVDTSKRAVKAGAHKTGKKLKKAIGMTPTLREATRDVFVGADGRVKPSAKLGAGLLGAGAIGTGIHQYRSDRKKS